MLLLKRSRILRGGYVLTTVRQPKITYGGNFSFNCIKNRDGRMKEEHSKPEHVRTEAESGYMQTWAYVHCVARNAELPVLFKFLYIFSFCESIWLNSYKLNVCIM